METIDEEKDYKLFIRVSPEFFQEFSEWAKRLRLTKSQLGNICVMSGFKSIQRAVSPEESLTPELWAKIIKAASDQGVELPEMKGENWKSK